MKVQKGLKEDAEKEVTRFQEANDNADKLATIATEIAEAKEQTDLLVQDFIDSRDALADAIQDREDSFFDKEQDIETKLFQANEESDEKKATQKRAIYEAAVNALDGLRTQNQNDDRLRDQFETQIRVLKNGFLITKAQLVAEMTNAELMVAIKQDLNAEEDMTDIASMLLNLYS